MDQAKRTELIEQIMWSGLDENELFYIARQKLGFAVYSDEALVLLRDMLRLTESGFGSVALHSTH